MNDFDNLAERINNFIDTGASPGNEATIEALKAVLIAEAATNPAAFHEKLSVLERAGISVSIENFDGPSASPAVADGPGHRVMRIDPTHPKAEGSDSVIDGMLAAVKIHNWENTNTYSGLSDMFGDLKAAVTGSRNDENARIDELLGIVPAHPLQPEPTSPIQFAPKM